MNPINIHDLSIGTQPSQQLAMPNDGKVARLEFQRDELANTLEELQEVLVDYSPLWYTEELHNKIETALQIVRDSQMSACGDGFLSHEEPVRRAL